jgi:hypothetical protein
MEGVGFDLEPLPQPVEVSDPNLEE